MPDQHQPDRPTPQSPGPDRAIICPIPGVSKPPPKRPFAPPAPASQVQPPESALDSTLVEIDAAVSPEDDLVPVPPPAADVFLPRSPAPRPFSGSRLRWLELKRTLIPVLLSGGVMLAVLGCLWFMTEPDSPFRDSGIWLPWTLLGTGLGLFVVGLLNALQVRHLLKQQAGS